VLDISLELFYGFEELARRAITSLGYRRVEVQYDRLNLLQGAEDIPMPEESFRAFHGLQHRIADRICLLALPHCLWQAFGGLLEDGQAHGVG
jgi:hypothetical protein